MVNVGQKVRFDPLAWIDASGAKEYKGTETVGTVVMVNYKHCWFLVEYDDGIRISFSFSDIGKAVKIIG